MNAAQLQQLANRLQQRIDNTPNDLNALADLAVVLIQLGQQKQALALLLPAAQQHPQHLLLQHNLAELYRNIGEINKAELLFARLIQEQSYFVPAYNSMIMILNDKLSSPHLNQEQRFELSKQLAILCNNKGNALLQAGQVESAQVSYHEALKYWTDYPSAHSNLSNVARLLGQLSDAEKYARTALALRSDFAEAWNNLGTALSEQGRTVEAIRCYQQALAVNPEQEEAKHNAGSGSLFLQLYRDDLTGKKIADAHRQWGKSLSIKPLLYPIIKVTDKIRIGFISADFRDHSVMYFAEALLEKLNRQEFEVVCYVNQSIEDHVTQRLKTLPLLWRSVVHLSDNALCEQIKQDKIHILIDLSGHSRGHRLYALAQKPTPVMATWLGYSFTTGLPAFDYRISDEWADPEEYAQAQHSERLIYLPVSQFNYRPKQDAPEVNDLPALKNGFITFGSLNNVQKINRTVVSGWSRVLHSVPNSRLIIHNKLLVDAGVAGRIRGLFEAFSVDMERLTLYPAIEQHLTRYHEIDIALDTFPYNGATTSCEALWMGVPVLSLVGNSSVSRMGVSILSSVGLHDWLAHSPKEYVELAKRHSSALPELSALRSTLRNQLKQSPLCDEERFAIDFANCVKQMLREKNIL